MSFNIEYNNDEKLEVLLFGDLDINTVESFETSILDKYSDLNKDIIFNLKELSYIDSTGLGAIMKIYKVAKDKEKTLTIKNARKNIRKLFVITELDQLFNMED